MDITLELPEHAGAIEQLLDTSFGPKRNSKTVYRLRGGVDPLPGLCFVALDPDAPGHSAACPKLAATLRYWPVTLGDAKVPSLLLGPIAVAPEYRSLGLGAAMIRQSLERAAQLGHGSVILVGDAPYYQRFGFSRELTLGLGLPGPVDPDRFLGLELRDGALAGLTGLVGKGPAAPKRRPATAAGGLAAPARRPARRAVR
ncbi:MAG TPA: N-acetyltransferase [Azospirillaceae bacterium]|nr:N-acetyltransferase [Azospirillaceae bacterium]